MTTFLGFQRRAGGIWALIAEPIAKSQFGAASRMAAPRSGAR
jgi:hypothetical protein